MGCNYRDLSHFAAFAYRTDCRFLLQGGDLVNGYTTRPDDYRTQFYGWKHAVHGFHAERPVYAAMGNHECLVYHFDDGSKYGLRVDRWPYDTQSSEVIYGEELVLPTNGPTASDPRRPTYRENVYSFQYGCVQCIAVNNNYWLCDRATQYGGSPEGYILPDQLSWIKRELQKAEQDGTVKFVFLFMQEPMLPNGGHIADAMWYHGDNRVRAGTWGGRQLQLEAAGIIDVRNELMRAVHASSKVVAVLGSDEHGYSKLRVDSSVPVGDPGKDDVNGDGWINYHGLDTDGDGKPNAVEVASPLHDLARPVWYLVGGGFGAPFYAREATPWNAYWDEKGPRTRDSFVYSSQPNILVFDVSESGVSMETINLFGETIDRINNLASGE
jgi:3',5'-cyclic AMP phosphodiesterase CpdA